MNLWFGSCNVDSYSPKKRTEISDRQARFPLTVKLKYYRAIPESLRDFRTLRYSSQDGHAEGEHVNRGRDTPSFCPTVQVLDMSTLGDMADVNPVIKFLPHTLHVCGRDRVDISGTCTVGQKLGVSLPRLTCSPSA